MPEISTSTHVRVHERDVSGTDEKLFSLRAGQLTRGLFIGTDWTRIRLGIRYSINADVNIYGNGLYMGVNKGITGSIGDANGTRFVGLRIYDPTWSRQAGPPPYFSNVLVSTVYREGLLETIGSNLLTGTMLPSSADVRGLLYMDIEKSSSTEFIVQMGYTFNPTGAQTDFTEDQFIEGMEIPLANLANWNSLLSASPAPTVTIAGDTGELDTWNLWWTPAVQGLEVYNLKHYRIS